MERCGLSEPGFFMANWDIVLPLDTEIADWLHNEGYPLLPIQPGNRLPSTYEMKSALAAQGNLILDYPSGSNSFYVYEKGADGFTLCIDGFDWDNDEAVPDRLFRIRWMCDLQASLLADLSTDCGQLTMIPESGAPVVVFPTILDAHSLTELLWKAHERWQEINTWEFVCKALYPDPASLTVPTAPASSRNLWRRLYWSGSGRNVMWPGIYYRDAGTSLFSTSHFRAPKSATV
jgi:hypothetical protein